MFGAPVKTGLTLTKVLGGISKTLSVANQVIPLYQQAKPMIKNAKTVLSVLKDMNKSPNNSSNKIIANQNVKPNNTNTNNVRLLKTNNPVFFL